MLYWLICGFPLKVVKKEKNDDIAWKYVTILHRRGNRDVLDKAAILCRSKNSVKRQLGADILGQLGVPKRTFPREGIKILTSMLKEEKNGNVINCIGVAIGHLSYSINTKEYKEARDLLLKHINHKNPNARFGIVLGISGQEDNESIKALIQLSNDRNNKVRDWATFGLGELIDKDTKEIKEALIARLNDPDCDVRSEAIKGLANRKYKSVSQAIFAEISKGNPQIIVLEAAQEIMSPQIYSQLIKLKKSIKGEKGTSKYWVKVLNNTIKLYQEKGCNGS